MTTQNLSVLQNATASDVRTDPYPFLVKRNALPDDLYDELAASYPSSEAMNVDTAANNQRWDYPARKVFSNRAMPQIWKDFIAYHSSQAFFDDFARLFFDGIHRLYPDRFPAPHSLKNLKAGVRGLSSFPRSDVLIDALVSGNTPVTKTSSVRKSHIDLGDKLYSGLFYMRPDDYDAVGGDLTISRFKPSLAGTPDRYKLYRGSSIDEGELETVETVTYDRNVVVLFVNSLDSIHGVTERRPCRKSRIFVNLVGEIDPPLYKQQKDGVDAHYLPTDHVSGRRSIRHRIKPALRRLFT